VKGLTSSGKPRFHPSVGPLGSPLKLLPRRPKTSWEEEERQGESAHTISSLGRETVLVEWRRAWWIQGEGKLFRVGESLLPPSKKTGQGKTDPTGRTSKKKNKMGSASLNRKNEPQRLRVNQRIKNTRSKHRKGRQTPVFVASGKGGTSNVAGKPCQSRKNYLPAYNPQKRGDGLTVMRRTNLLG